MDKITVIVPVYNTGKYLEQCLESVLMQTYYNIQILCINDGSTDNSKDILQRFAEKDSRLQIINQDNRGYGAAVNKGLDLADGEYINIVESDDFLDPVTIESLYRFAKGFERAEIIKFAYWDYFDLADGTHKISPSCSSVVETHLYPFQISQYPELLIYHPSIWSCLYRHDFIRDNNLRFVEAPDAGWSDNPFFFASMLLAKNIIWSNEKHYYYRRTNPACSSNLIDCRIPFQRMLETGDFIEQNNITNPIILDYFYKRCLNYIQVVLDNPHYCPDVVNPFIIRLVSRIKPEILQNNFFTDDELRVYKLFYKEGKV